MLLITAETYSKYVHSQRPQPAGHCLWRQPAATLIEARDEPTLTALRFGTDGSGGDTLLVAKGGARPPRHALKPRNRHRWPGEPSWTAPR